MDNDASSHARSYVHPSFFLLFISIESKHSHMQHAFLFILFPR
jgi:hypothetical protein